MSGRGKLAVSVTRLIPACIDPRQINAYSPFSSMTTDVTFGYNEKRVIPWSVLWESSDNNRVQPLLYLCIDCVSQTVSNRILSSIDGFSVTSVDRDDGS